MLDGENRTAQSEERSDASDVGRCGQSPPRLWSEWVTLHSSTPDYTPLRQYKDALSNDTHTRE